MPVLLKQSSDLPANTTFNTWLAVTGTNVDLDKNQKLPDLAERLEQAFMANRKTWWTIGKELSTEPTAEFAHMPTGGAFGSDFGVMLAWSELVQSVAAEKSTCLVVCDDPWLFRHLSALPGVQAGTPPNLFVAELKLTVRGWFARTKVALKAALAALSVRTARSVQKAGGSAILVYGHPRSTANGFDAYFGNLMSEEPGLTRVLHVDCDVARARELAKDGRTSSLHGWGSFFYALFLVGTKWRTNQNLSTNENGWLIRRSMARENSGGGPAMTRWQMHCQDRWLNDIKPDRVCWPWENHAWERGLCRTARKYNVQTLGYQHTVVGPHQINYSTATNPDGLKSIPDWVICDGPAYRNEVAAWGIPEDRLVIGGAFRFKRFSSCYDSSGPIFVPLSAISIAAQYQIQAAKKLAAIGKKVILKEHPMYPAAFHESENMIRTQKTLSEQTALSAVLFSTGTSGLEAVLMGIPAYRLIFDDLIAINVVPANITVQNVTLENLEKQLTNQVTPPAVDWDQVLSEPDMKLWHSLLFGDMHANNNNYSMEAQQSL